MTVPGVLGNDTDAETDPLTAVRDDDVSHGNLTLNSDGSFTYTPTALYSGPDSFTYHANDGSADSNVVTVSLTIAPAISYRRSFWTASGSLRHGECHGDRLPLQLRRHQRRHSGRRRLERGRHRYPGVVRNGIWYLSNSLSAGSPT